MNNFVEIVVPGLIAVLCIARQFIAGVTGSPLSGVSTPAIGRNHIAKSKGVLRELESERYVQGRKWKLEENYFVFLLLDC